MELQQRFDDYIRAQDLCDPAKHRILLAVSGGKDSMLMTYLFAQAGYRVGIAHCHFGLRGEDADLDESLVLEYAKTLEVPVFVRHFETEAYARKEGISIQMAARDLRYGWFDELAEQVGFDRIALGQHASDQVETILINQLRGTGLRGWQGMLPRRGKLIRPLLFLTAEEVAAQVRQLGLSFRDDQSNFSLDYLRNRIRWRVVPEMKAVHSGLEESFGHNARAAGQVISFLDEQMQRFRREWFSRRGEIEILRLDGLRGYDSSGFILYELLRPYGFSAAVCEDIKRSLEAAADTEEFVSSGHPASSGQQFYSSSHELLLDRNEVWIRSTTEPVPADQIWLQSAQPGKLQWAGQALQADFQSIADFDRNIFASAASKKQAYFDADEVRFPLRIRSWQEGDRFRPFGMGGKHKKVSDLFTELTIGLWAKKNIPILEDATGTILWVAPHRQSWEYNICDKTMNVMTISYFCEDGG